MTDLGKVLIFAGALLVLAGLLLLLAGRLHLPLGHLPGDIVLRRKNAVFYFPIVTGIVLSVLLTLLFYLLGRFRS